VNKLLANFNNNPLKPRAVHDTGWEYRKSGNYDKADELDRYVIERWPKDVQAMWSRMDMAKTDIWQGNYDSADKAIDTLIADFNDQPELPTAIFMLGEEYYNKAFVKENEGQQAESKDYFRKAVAIWERIINELPRSSMAPQAYYFAGRCYESLREYEKAIEYYQAVVDTWPDYDYAWNAQFLIGYCYKSMMDRAVIEKSEAQSHIQAAFEQVVLNYPESPAAKMAGDWLRNCQKCRSSQEKQGE